MQLKIILAIIVAMGKCYVLLLITIPCILEYFFYLFFIHEIFLATSSVLSSRLPLNSTPLCLAAIVFPLCSRYLHYFILCVVRIRVLCYLFNLNCLFNRVWCYLFNFNCLFNRLLIVLFKQALPTHVLIWTNARLGFIKSSVVI